MSAPDAPKFRSRLGALVNFAAEAKASRPVSRCRPKSQETGPFIVHRILLCHFPSSIYYIFLFRLLLLSLLIALVSGICRTRTNENNFLESAVVFFLLSHTQNITEHKVLFPFALCFIAVSLSIALYFILLSLRRIHVLATLWRFVCCGV